MMLVQETMQKIVSDNLLAYYIIYSEAWGEKYRVTNRLNVDDDKASVLYEKSYKSFEKLLFQFFFLFLKRCQSSRFLWEHGYIINS